MKYLLTEVVKAEKRGEFDYAETLKQIAHEERGVMKDRVRTLKAANKTELVDVDF